ncbi:MAG: radical SAM/SPASM domain-containing protein [Actinomycetota bacterium]
MQAYEREPAIRLHRTARGGRAFDPRRVTTLELDDEAFDILSGLTAPRTAREIRRGIVARCNHNVTLAAVAVLLEDLTALGFVRRPLPGSRGDSPALAAAPPFELHPPESVHLQLNNTCNLRCPSCYVGLQSEDVGSLPLERLLELVDELAELGVFQLALGGGEPLMSPKLAPVARRARASGMIPNVTTNGWLLTPDLLDEVDGALGEVRLSLNDAVSVNLGLLEERAALMRARGVRFGFNVIVTRGNLPELGDWLRWACDQGAATVTLIRPKPAPGNEGWYARCALGPVENRELQRILLDLEPLFANTALAVDCALSFLFQGRPEQALHDQGVAGCAMGERFAVIAWNGDVLPCSHLHGGEFRAGSVVTDTFRQVWERSNVFARVRRDLRQVEGQCGDCGHNAFCKGCRAVAGHQTGNWLAPDLECAVAVPESSFIALSAVR